MPAAARPARTFVAAGLLPALVGWALLPATSQPDRLECSPPSVPCRGEAFAPSSADLASDGANASPLPSPTWTYDDLHGLDPWGDSDGDARDLIAEPGSSEAPPDDPGSALRSLLPYCICLMALAALAIAVAGFRRRAKARRPS